MTYGRNVTMAADAGLAEITVNRPQALNALNADTLNELRAAVLAAAIDPAVRVLVITGAGPKAFVAGADIAQMRDLSPLEGREFTMLGQEIFALIENLAKPVIAAVNGFALGGGCELAMACDIRIAAATAKFGQPEVNLGIIPGFGGTQRLARLIGRGRAKYCILTGQIISAQEAYELGLVDKVVEPDALLDTCRAVAATIGAKAPVAVALAKRAINRGLDMDLASAIAFEAEAYATCFATADRVEGMTAFLEKRPAKFAGK